MADDRSAALDSIAAETDPLAGLAALAKYIADGEAKLRRARRMRGHFVAQARDQAHTWPQITSAGKAGEAYLRREMEDAKRTPTP